MGDGCVQCGYGGGGHVVHVTDKDGDRKYCTQCAADTIKALSRHRFMLAAALGYDTKCCRDQIPAQKKLVNEVKRLVEFRNNVQGFFKWMEDQCDTRFNP